MGVVPPKDQDVIRQLKLSVSLDPGPQGKGEGPEIELINSGQWCNQSQLCNVKVIQSGPTLCNPIDYTVHGMLQARILEWVAVPFSKGSSQPRNQTMVSCIAGGLFTNWASFFTDWAILYFPEPGKPYIWGGITISSPNGRSISVLDILFKIDSKSPWKNKCWLHEPK